jgi:hypothetical protein
MTVHHRAAGVLVFFQRTSRPRRVAKRQVRAVVAAYCCDAMVTGLGERSIKKAYLIKGQKYKGVKECAKGSSPRVRSMAPPLYLASVNNGVRADVAQDDGILCHREGETVFLGDIRFPNVGLRFVSMDSQGGVPGIFKE